MLSTAVSFPEPVASRDRVEHSLRPWIVLSFAVLLLVKGWLSYTRYFNQDEFETLHQGWLISQGAVQFRDFQSNHPPLGFELLGLFSHMTDDPRVLLWLGRTATMGGALLTWSLIAAVTGAVYGRRAAGWSLILGAWNATFWEWSTEIRTDFLMVPLWLTSLLVLLAERPRREWLRMWTVGLLLGAAIWVNQKAILHAVPVGLYLVLERRPWRERARALCWLCAGGLVPTGIVTGRIWWSGAWRVLLEHNFVGAWALAREAPYAGFRAFTLWTAWTRDTGFVLLSLVATLAGLRGLGDRRHGFVVGAAAWMLFTLLLTPGPFPYYLLSVFPLFVVVSAGWLARTESAWRAGATAAGSARRWVVVGLVAAFVMFPLLRLSRLLRPTNEYQMAVLGLAHALTDRSTPVFDGAGTLLTRPDAYPFHWVLWETERRKLRAGELPPLLATLRHNGCRLVIDTYRLRDLPDEDRAALEQHFVPFWGPIRIPGWDSQQPVGADPVRCELWHDGLYESNRADLLVDGQLMAAPRYLQAGWHTLAVTSGSGRVQLREISRTRGVKLPPDVRPASLFLGTYGYTY